MLTYVKTSLVEILENLIWNYICSKVKECCLQFLLTGLYRPAPLALGLKHHCTGRVGRTRRGNSDGLAQRKADYPGRSN
jgi:hypothetical protein